MMKNEKILITGVSSSIGQAFARSLAGNNEVWGTARFSNPEIRADLDRRGVKTVQLDLGAGDLSGVPTDFTQVVHLAYFRSQEPDFEQAFRTNGDGTGFVLSHCRKAKAALYMSSQVVYSFHEDPWNRPKETDPIGGSQPAFSKTSGVSKIAGEAVARFCARTFNLPVTVARLNAPYGNWPGMMPTIHMDMVVAGKEIFARWDPEPYTPIHIDDMADQLEAMLGAASIPVTVVNWAGDEVVTVQEWSRMAAEWHGTEAKLGVRVAPSSLRGSSADTTKRRSITGPCRVVFKDGLRQIYDARHGSRAPAKG
jgi:nucleoside-diphosphate-sugar epimerase